MQSAVSRLRTYCKSFIPRTYIPHIQERSGLVRDIVTKNRLELLHPNKNYLLEWIWILISKENARTERASDMTAHESLSKLLVVLEGCPQSQARH